MRFAKKILSMYSVDFWVYILAIVILTFLIRGANHQKNAPLATGYAGNANAIDLQASVASDEDVYLTVFAIVAVACVLLIQVNKQTNESPLSWFSMKVGKKFETRFSQVEMNNYHATVLTLTSLVFVFMAHTACALIVGRQLLVLLALLVVLAIIFAALCMCVVVGLTDRARYLLIGFCMIFPVAVTVAAGESSAGFIPNSYAWIVAALAFSMLLLDRKASKLFFKLFACVLFIGTLCQVFFMPSVDFIKMLDFVSNIFYAGFIIFAPLDFHIDRSLDNYSILENINNELKETQTKFAQREQMATLGQLIAGIAHEINTPIGAIKASAEMLETLDIGKLAKDTGRYKGDALEAFETVLGLSTRSVKNMRSTRDVRRGRAQVREFIRSIGIDEPDRISALLAQMEICDVQKIESNIDLFKRDDIVEILTSVRAMIPYINSLQRISFATNGVSKIIFSLRSFSHMNLTGEKHLIDIAQNIDNVLVLYHNQIKRGIEIIKQYDEDIPMVYGNIEELNQVWTNIVQNAIHAMSHVGQLTIRIQNIKDQKVAVSFTDTGTGISPENLEKLFQPFFTTKPLGEGSGLGLDISQKVIKKHDGDIKVESRKGQGATFTVTLPVQDQGGRQ